MDSDLQPAQVIWDAARTFLYHKASQKTIDIATVRFGLNAYFEKRGEDAFWHSHLFLPRDEKNPGQNKFIEVFRAGMLMRQPPKDDGIRVHTIEQWELDVINPQLSPRGKSSLQHQSFSAQISFFLGAYWAGKKPKHIVLISDAYDLSMPAVTCASAGIPVTLAWFNGFVDMRWNRVIQNTSVKFLDLGSLRSADEVIEARRDRTLKPFG